MKQLYLILSLLLSLPLVAMAQDDGNNYLVTEETTCQPKPYIHINFPKGDGSIYSNSKCTNVYYSYKLRNKSTFTTLWLVMKLPTILISLSIMKRER